MIQFCELLQLVQIVCYIPSDITSNFHNVKHKHKTKLLHIYMTQRYIYNFTCPLISSYETKKRKNSEDN
jgi:hypothetical protein